MTYHYTMCGLDYIYLKNGYRRQETEYGAGVSIERAHSLDRSIAVSVLTSFARLRGQEVRFMRSLVDFSQTDLAVHLGVKRITVARWEAAPKTPIPGPADRAFRVLAASKLFDAEWAISLLDMFAEIADEKPSPIYMTFKGHGEDSEPLLSEEPAKEEDWTPAQAA